MARKHPNVARLAIKPTVPAERWVTVAQAADRLGVSTSRVYQFIDQGRLHPRRLGQLIVLDREELKTLTGRRPGRPRKGG